MIGSLSSRIFFRCLKGSKIVRERNHEVLLKNQRLHILNKRLRYVSWNTLILIQNIKNTEADLALLILKQTLA